VRPLPPIRIFLESTILEWEGCIAAVVCLAGCNLRCPFCHSSGLTVRGDPADDIPFDTVAAVLDGRRSWIDGVVISGGEPTIHAELPDLAREIRALGFAVKIDTNGTNPDALAYLLEEGLVDYVAMDLKAPLEPEAYARACGVRVDIEELRRSIALVTARAPDYEFRTTLVPGLHRPEDAAAIARAIPGARRYILQGFRPQECLDASYLQRPAFPKSDLFAAATAASAHVALAYARGERAPTPAYSED